jgi:cytochrome c-type biogenesis protein CcmE
MTKTLISAIALIAMVGAASAATITNDDKMSHKIKFLPTHGKVVHVAVKAGKDWNFDCSKGGMLMMGKAKQTCDAKTINLSIKDGKFVI